MCFFFSFCRLVQLYAAKTVQSAVTVTRTLGGGGVSASEEALCLDQSLSRPPDAVLSLSSLTYSALCFIAAGV